MSEIIIRIEARLFPADWKAAIYVYKAGKLVMVGVKDVHPSQMDAEKARFETILEREFYDNNFKKEFTDYGAGLRAVTVLVRNGYDIKNLG